MKCKHCDGTGRRMEESDNGIGWIPIECEYCNGTGEVEQTNEEWFCGLSTEEKAEALARGSGGLIMPYDADKFTVAEVKRRWEKWLKQPHSEGNEK